MRCILFPNHISVSIPERAIHTAASGRLAHHIRIVGYLFAAVVLFNVSKSQKHNGNFILV